MNVITILIQLLEHLCWPCLVTTSKMIWDVTIWHSLKQSTWLRISLCGGCCLCQALRSLELHARNDDDSVSKTCDTFIDYQSRCISTLFRPSATAPSLLTCVWPSIGWHHWLADHVTCWMSLKSDILAYRPTVFQSPHMLRFAFSWCSFANCL